ncbi:hypothetical protein LOC57_14950 [Arthrobacter sp. zg-Y750]|nr:hypothetical protein [Arthrobacter sp. zg-Y750]
MPEPEGIRAAAKSLLTSAAAIQSITENAAQSWGKLQAQDVYVIDGAEVVFSAYRPIQRASRDFADDFGTLDAAANVFADAVVDLRARLADVKARAAALNQEAAADDEWTKDKDLIAEQDWITNELNTISAELSGHERAFAQSISDLYNGNEYVEYSENGPAEGQFEHGIPRDVLNAAAAEGQVPWAHPQEFDKPWYRDAGDAYWAYTKAFFGTGLDTVLGLAALAGLGGKDAFVQSWKGVGTLAHDLFIVTGAGMPFMMATGQEQKVKDSAGNLLEIAKDTIHLDEWKTDPASALGATAFDVVTTIGTGGAAAGVKGVSVAGKAADAAGDAGKLAKAGEAAAAGGRMAHIAETTGIAKGVRAVEEISVKIGEIKTTAVQTISESPKTDLGRLGSGHDAKHAAPDTRAAAPDTVTRAPETQPKAPGVDTPGGPARGPHVPEGTVPSKADPDTGNAGSKLPDDAAGPKAPAPGDNGPHAGDGGLDGGTKGPGKPDDLPTVTADAAGQPTEVEFPDGTRISVDYPIETPRNDIIRELGPALESIGKDEAWLRNVVEQEVESLSEDELQALMELRHSIPSLDADTVMQKVIDGKSFEALLDGSDLYGNSAGGFITRASDAADLRTPEDVYNALRLDYKNTKYLPNNDKPVYAVQFRAGKGLDDIQIPDGRGQDELRRHGLEAADPTGRPYPEPHEKQDPWPNTGHGWTGSTVDHSKIIPEYAVRQGTGVPYNHGDVIWEINETGERVLVAIFDKDMPGANGARGMWRRVAGSGG